LKLGTWNLELEIWNFPQKEKSFSLVFLQEKGFRFFCISFQENWNEGLFHDVTNIGTKLDVNINGHQVGR
jgi:hypothetical protein